MPKCPICQSSSFKTYRGRVNARCTGCGSKERARLMAMAIRLFTPEKSEKKVFHFAPEMAIADILLEKYAHTYQAADYSPEIYAWSKVPLLKVDLCRPLDYLQPASVHGLIHSHVLEHIPGSVERVIVDLNKTIAPGGFHLFQVPIERGWYREDMNPDMPAEEREKVFKQHDHLRMFGDQDFEDRILSLFEDFDRIDIASKITTEDLVEAAVPPSSLTEYNGHSAFLFIKR